MRLKKNCTENSEKEVLGYILLWFLYLSTADSFYHKIFKINFILLHTSIYFFLSLQVGGIVQVLQSDWFREQAVFYDLAC